MVVTLAMISPNPAFAAPLTHTIRGETGIGYDSNPFLAPDDPYFDMNSGRWVTPERQGGFFTPVRLTGGLVQPLGVRGHRFITEYRADGDFYTAESISSADEAFLKVEPGFLFNLDYKSSRNRVFDIRAYGSYNRDLYYDRDTGLPATSGGVDVSNRFKYRAAGLELNFDYEVTRRLRFYFSARGEIRDYDDPEVVDPFDQDRLRTEMGTTLRFSRQVRLDLGYLYEIRDYSERTARSLDGNTAVGNPLLRYEIDSLVTNLRLRPLRPWRLELIYEHTKRADTFVDYNTYAQDKVRLRSTVRQGKVQWRLEFEYWERDFDNAFIFDEPIDPQTGLLNPNKFYETLEIGLEGYFPIKRHLRLYTAVEYVDQTANDPRFDYDRDRAIVGVELLY